MFAYIRSPSSYLGSEIPSEIGKVPLVTRAGTCAFALHKISKKIGAILSSKTWIHQNLAKIPRNFIFQKTSDLSILQTDIAEKVAPRSESPKRQSQAPINAALHQWIEDGGNVVVSRREWQGNICTIYGLQGEDYLVKRETNKWGIPPHSNSGK